MEDTTVVIHVRGGVAYCAHCPPGIDVEIVDYDDREEEEEET
jgi:hypothetical protein